jgi:hypothetical protein
VSALPLPRPLQDHFRGRASRGSRPDLSGALPSVARRREVPGINAIAVERPKPLGALLEEAVHGPLRGTRRRPRGGDSGHARHSSRSPRHRTRRWAWARCRTPRGVAPRPNVIDGSDEPADPPMSARHWLMVWRWHWTHPQPGRAPRRRVEAAEAPQSFHHTYGDSARPDTMLEMAPDRFRNPPHPSGTKT